MLPLVAVVLQSLQHLTASFPVGVNTYLVPNFPVAVWETTGVLSLTLVWVKDSLSRTTHYFLKGNNWDSHANSWSSFSY